MMAVTIGSMGRLPSHRSLGVIIWAIKVYEAVPRKKDDLYIWKLKEVLHRVTGKTISNKTEVLALQMAYDRKLLFVKGITQNMRVLVSPLELLAMEGMDTVLACSTLQGASMPDICDATTASGKQCKNLSEGEFGGKGYCGIMSHKKQILGMAPLAEEALAEQAEEALDAQSKEVEQVGQVAVPSAETAPDGIAAIEEAAAEAVEAAVELDTPGVAIGKQKCPSCRPVGQPIFWGEASAEPHTQLVCMICNSRWRMDGSRW